MIDWRSWSNAAEVWSAMNHCSGKREKTRMNQSEQAEMCMKVFVGITGEDTRITTDPTIEVHTALVQE